MRKLFIIPISLFAAGMLFATVPNRITYQGRLFKSGVAVSGPKSIRLALVHPSTLVELESEVFNVTLPATGEFTIVWDATLDAGFDWRGVNPQLKISVDGEALSPNELLGVSPYSFVARTVDVGGVDTAALADGAVTNAKVAVGIAASKILITTNTYLSDWRHPTQLDKVDATKIYPPLATDSIIFSSPSVAQFIQASQPVTPLTIKGKSGVVGTVPVFDVRDNSDELRFRVRGAGEQFLSGPVGLGTETPGAPLDIVSSSASVVLRNTQAPEASRTWQVAVNNLGRMNIQATNAALSSPVSALALSRDGLVDIPTARISSSTIQNLTSTNLVTQNLNSVNLVAQSLTATSLGFGTVTASSLTVQNISAGTSTIQNLSSTNLTASSATIGQLISTNLNASIANIGNAKINSFGAPVSGGLTVDSLTVNNVVNLPAVAARVDGSSNLSIPTSPTLVTFPNESFDTSNFFNLSSPGRLVAPRNGVYLVSFEIRGTNIGDCILKKNGTEIERITPVSGTVVKNPSAIELKQNDYLELFANRSGFGGGTVTTRSFQIILLGILP
ncbi:MAG: hypothetical protein IPN65_04350 [Elusimicrobia bacterium]|nr:hypothetical protein [Elusimicrobiota bacterium]MBK7206766.1 hypothetical protein [Elusimicrobiota bacterium]MBK7687885.1 hypothetical protein [Elusimicrobiota bacterium]MBK8125196.1 hypothetical protein [Elusimicrobiota bacterium]MBK8652242.1 hypothetical protein [Elusimicrobiota bacterium]